MGTSALPADFMERVVAWPGPEGPGFVNLHWQAPEARGAGFRGRPFKTLPDFMDLAQRGALKPGTFKEIYFCLSTQKMTGKLIHGEPVAHRHATQASALKALWIDVDVKPEKGYATLKEARSAIAKFLGDASLPAPSAIVHSGGGIHVYWISDKPLTVAQWERYAHGLRAEIMKHGLKCDAGLTTDAARVLRVPGTFNNKLDTPRPVILNHLGESYDFEQTPEIARLATIVQVSERSRATATVTRASAPPFDMTNFPPNGMHQMLRGELDPADAISGINLHADMPLKLDEVERGCTHFQDCKVTHGKLHPEPLWQLTLLASSFFENGREIAHTYSDGYPTYTRDETDKKYDQKLEQKAAGNLGWPSCDAFEGAGAKCKSCPFYKKLRSPLNLAERAAPIPVVIQAAAPPEDLLLPPGFTLNADEQICEIVTKKESNGMSHDEMYPLFWSKLRNPVLQGGRRAFMFDTSLDGKNWGPVSLLEVNLATDQAMLKQLRDCGVKPYVKNQGRINHFMTSWMHRLDQARNRVQTVPFGWLRTGESMPTGFAYGGKVFMSDGTEQMAGYTDPQLTKYYVPTGLEQPWRDALKVVTDQHHPALEAIIATGFAAPLMLFTGLYNCLAHAWSPESGAHKSFAIHLGAGIWGCPKMTKESPMSSPKGLVHKMSEVKNLPIYWDEVSDEEKLDQIRPMLGIMTEGTGGTLLTQARQFHQKDDWQTLTLVGANKSLTANITRAIKDTDAQLQRVFEFEVEKRGKTMSVSEAAVLIGSLDENYGHLGLAYAKLLGTDPEAAAKRTRFNVRRFEKLAGNISEERFRTAMAGCIYTGAELANQYLGTAFNLQEIWDFLIREFQAQCRLINEAEIVGGSVVNTINATSQFLKAHTRNALWIGALPVRQSGRPEAIVYIAGPCRTQPDTVHVRFSVANRLMEISRERFLTYLKNVGHNGNAVLTGLRKHYGAKEVAKVSLSAGAGVVGGREHVIRMEITNDSPWVEELFKWATIEERQEAGLGETAAIVTTAVTPEQAKFQKGDGPEQLPAKETGIAAAIGQATKDLGTVRRNTV